MSPSLWRATIWESPALVTAEGSQIEARAGVGWAKLGPGLLSKAGPVVPKLGLVPVRTILDNRGGYGVDVWCLLGVRFYGKILVVWVH